MVYAQAYIPPLGERQFTQYLTKAAGANPDVLCLLNAGEDTVAAIRQWYNFGMKNVKVVAPWSLEVEQLRELTPAMREGLIIGENYYHAIDTPLNNSFVKKYQEQYNSPPGYATAYAYDSYRTMLMAMEKANSVETAAVVKALEGMHYQGLLGPTYIEASNHQTVRPYFVLVGKPKKAMKNPTDFAEIVAEGHTPLPASLNVCKNLGPY